MKKFLAIMAATIMMISVFTACSEQKATVEEKNTDSEIEATIEKESDDKSIADKTVEGKVEQTAEDEKEETEEVEETEDVEETEEVEPTEKQEKKDAVQKNEKKDVLASMSSKERTEVNTFMSNFSEALCSEDINNNDERKISFAWIHAGINGGYGDCFYRGNDKMGISAKVANQILDRFFGTTIPEKTPEGSEWWRYEDGYFVMNPASGETYAYFSIATAMFDNGDGTYTVKFNVYHDPESIHEGPKKEWYTCTAEQASAKYKLLGSYEAIIRPKTHNGEKTYEMVEYMS